jgi:CubicO group peptidase (beta-lactamase class C family)
MTEPRFEKVCETVRSEMHRLPIPGVAVGILYGGEEQIAGFGVTSVENPLPVTRDTLYQIGSISKTFLGTLVMRLVEMGKLDLHAPLKSYLPELKLRDETAANRATLFHCLTHTGGWVGDYFDDFGRGESSLVGMVDAMQHLEQLTSLEQVWSYNNAGFYLAGRVIEVVTGKSFEAAMQEYLFDPLELKSSYFFAEDVISRPFVVGHYKKDEKPIVARPWALARTANPAGGIISNIPDLFRYARFHLGDGTAPDGTHLLSQESLREMQAPRFAATDPEWVGLTWYIREVQGTKIFGHSGGTTGQITKLQIVPAHNMAFAILTNGDHGTLLINSVTKTILEQYLGIVSPDDKPITMPQSVLESYVGQYNAALDNVVVSVGDGELILHVTNKGGFPTPPTPPPPTQPPPVRAVFYGEDKIFVRDDPYKDYHGEFLRGEGGEVEWLRMFGRIHKRVSGD